jgi:hypothetical protein
MNIKTLLPTLIVLLFANSVFSQNDRFVRKYSQVSFYDNDKGEYEEFRYAVNTFVFNINANGDIRVYNADNSETILIALGGTVDRSETENGLKYQVMTYVSDSGYETSIYLFDEAENGLIMITNYDGFQPYVWFIP